jgi:hypothetical protein
LSDATPRAYGRLVAAEARSPDLSSTGDKRTIGVSISHKPKTRVGQSSAQFLYDDGTSASNFSLRGHAGNLVRCSRTGRSVPISATCGRLRFLELEAEHSFFYFPPEKLRRTPLYMRIRSRLSGKQVSIFLVATAICSRLTQRWGTDLRPQYEVLIVRELAFNGSAKSLISTESACGRG